MLLSIVISVILVHQSENIKVLRYVDSCSTAY